MAKARSADDGAADERPDAVEGIPVSSGEKPAASKVKIIIEKYLVNRGEIDPSLRRVLAVIYKGETHTVTEWDGIINRRLSRPAD